MKTDLSWLVGRHLEDVVRYEFSWAFVFGENASISAPSFWRLVASEGIDVTSEDDGHLFGLGVPVDARQRVLDAVRAKKVVRYQVTELTSDLVISFEDSVELHFLNTSCGYESWTADRESHHTISLGGGGVCTVDTKKQLNQIITGNSGASPFRV